MKFAPVTTRVLVHADRNVVMIELNSELEQRVRWGALELRARYPQAEVYETREIAAGKVGVASQELIREASFAVAIGAHALGFEVAAGEQGLQGVIEFGGEKGPALLVVAVATERESGDLGHVERALGLLQESLDAEPESLR